MDKLQTCESGVADEVFSSPDLDDFDILVHQYRPRILRFVLASLRDREAAENITQECFVRAYKSRMQFRGTAAVLTWLMRIAANLVRDHENSGRVRFWKKTLRADLTAADLGACVDERQKTPEAIASAKQQIQAIWNVAARLPRRQRTVLLLRFVEDMELLEIAAVTGMKEGTVKTHLFRALQSIRSELDESKLRRKMGRATGTEGAPERTKGKEI